MTNNQSAVIDELEPLPDFSSTSILRGEVVEASYQSNQVIKRYKGNPMIEALPDIMSESELFSRIPNYPDYDDSQCQLDKRLRLHCVQQLSDYVELLPVHLSVEQRFSRMIRHGYVARNPLKKQYAKQFQVGFKELLESGTDKNKKNAAGVRSTAAGFNIIGVSGQGKSTTVELNLLLYPQVIEHTSYNNQPFILNQLVWVKLNCPFDGSIKGLCINFLQAVDSILHTKYYKRFVKPSTTTDTLIPIFAHIASLHCLGVLVIDEIQNLRHASSGGADKTLNFFTQLVNTIGVPVVLIGTYKSLGLFGGSFSPARRGTGQGSLIIDRMAEKEGWDYFITRLWEYQWTATKTILTPRIKSKMYELSQGIIDVAVKLYMLVQWDAIANAEFKGTKERITIKRLDDVFSEQLKLIKPMIEALRTGGKSTLHNIDDLYPQWNDLSEYLSKAEEKVTIEGVLKEKLKPEDNVEVDKKVFLDMIKLAITLGAVSETAEEIVRYVLNNNENHADILKLRTEVAKHVIGGYKHAHPNDLRNHITKETKPSAEDIYNGLSSAGYTGSNDLLFPEEGSQEYLESSKVEV